MRAYVGHVDASGLRWFLPEDAVPEDLLRQLVREWLSRTTTVVWAAVAEEDAEAVRRELETGCHQAACDVLLNRAVELLTLAHPSHGNNPTSQTQIRGSDAPWDWEMERRAF